MRRVIRGTERDNQLALVRQYFSFYTLVPCAYLPNSLKAHTGASMHRRPSLAIMLILPSSMLDS
jgi:hypothetical protein